MGLKRNHRRLQRALTSGNPVQLVRSIQGADEQEGFVVGLAREWVVLHYVDEVRLNGWGAVRLDTVSTVHQAEPNSLVVRALRARGQRPVGLDVDLSSTETIIASLASALPLVTFHREALYPDECLIGRPIRFTKKKVHFVDIHTDASWDPIPVAFKLADLTRLDAGGDYESALYQLGGDPPTARTK